MKSEEFTREDALRSYDKKKMMNDITNHPFFFLLRPISRRISVVLANFKVKPTSITFVGLFVLMGSWGLIVRNDSIVDYYLGGICLLLWCLFDVIDGDLARLTKNITILGSISDTFSGYLFHTITPIVIAISIYFDPNVENLAFFTDKLIIVVISVIESFCFIFRVTISDLAEIKFSYSSKMKNNDESISIISIIPKAIFNLRAVFFLASVYFDILIYYLVVYSLITLVVLTYVLINILNGARNE